MASSPPGSGFTEGLVAGCEIDLKVREPVHTQQVNSQETWGWERGVRSVVGGKGLVSGSYTG